jgi:hypothetical protein
MPVRVTEEQAAMLFGAAVARPKGRKVAARKPHDALPENQVESICLGYLRACGWTVERQQAGTVCGLGPLLQALDRSQAITRELVYRSLIRSGSKGRCDWVAVRHLRMMDHSGMRAIVAVVQRFELEIKAPGRKPSPEQLDYIRQRNATGLLATWCDRLLPSDPGESEALLTWYERVFGR